LFAAYEKISRDLDEADKTEIEKAVLEIAAFSTLSEGEIYTKGKEIWETLEKLANL
jgi:hypothetical protein